MSEGSPSYGDLLREDMKAAGTSRRALSFALAERKGTTKQESEYRALGKYLSDKEIPEPEQAAILAVELRAPRLALVTTAVERRRSRRTAVEAQAAQNTVSIEALREAVRILLGQVEALAGARVEGIPAAALPPTVEGNGS